MLVLLIQLWLWPAQAEPTVEIPDDMVLEDDVRAEVELALQMLGEGRFDGAARALRALADAGDNPDLRYLEALARYESGDLRRADRAAAQGVAAAPEHGALLSLHGLVLADLGRGEEALVVLEHGGQVAKASRDDALLARITLNEGLVWLDQGDVSKAGAAFRKAERLGGQTGQTAVVEQARVNQSVADALSGGSGSRDLVGRVVDRLRRGEVDAAAGLLPTNPDVAGRREAIEARVARAAVRRAQGRYDDAATDLQVALVFAREGGMTRDLVRVLGELGTVHWLARRDLVAREHLREATDTADGTHFGVLAVDLNAMAGLVDLRLGDLASARARLAAGRTRLRGIEHPLGGARLSELEGAIENHRGDLPGAAAAYASAIEVFERRAYWADAARVGTEVVRLYAGRDAARAEAASEMARDQFRRAGDPLGEAHVELAVGLGRAREGDMDGSLTAFLAAAGAADTVGTPRAAELARIARDDAAEALRVLGHGEQSVARAAELGLEDALARHDTFAAAKQAWVEGMDAWEAQDWERARERFDTATRGFSGLGEHGYAKTARRGRAWAQWNLAVGRPASVALPFYEEIVQEAIQIDDPELRVRARAAKALSAMEIPQIDAGPLLVEAAADAESIGMDEMASQCWAGLAEIGDDLDVRARAARQAHALHPGGAASAYAMYSVAVDAYNADRYDLAEALSNEVLGSAGELEDAVVAVLEASVRARDGQ